MRAAVARRGSENSVLSATVEPHWLGYDEAVALVAELTALLTADLRPDDGLDLRRAAAIAQFGVDTGTGTQVRPARVSEKVPLLAPQPLVGPSSRQVASTGPSAIEFSEVTVGRKRAVGWGQHPFR